VRAGGLPAARFEQVPEVRLGSPDLPDSASFASVIQINGSFAKKAQLQKSRVVLKE
jgi:hypothetical protein